MKRYDLMPSRILRVLLLVLIYMTVALIVAPRDADAARVVKIKSRPVKVISSHPRTVVRCGNELYRRVWVRGHWEQTGPRMSRWMPGHWTLIPRS